MHGSAWLGTRHTRAAFSRMLKMSGFRACPRFTARVLPFTDIEGAEHAILGEMLAAGTMSRIDVLALECHSWTTHGLAAPKRAYRTCSSLLRELAKANPRMRLVTESAGAPGYEGGHDAHSAPPSAAELARTVQRCA